MVVLIIDEFKQRLGLVPTYQSKNENIFDENGKVKADYAERLNKNMLYNVCRYQAEANTSEEGREE